MILVFLCTFSHLGESEGIAVELSFQWVLKKHKFYLMQEIILVTFPACISCKNINSSDLLKSNLNFLANNFFIQWKLPPSSFGKQICTFYSEGLPSCQCKYLHAKMIENLSRTDLWSLLLLNNIKQEVSYCFDTKMGNWPSTAFFQERCKIVEHSKGRWQSWSELCLLLPCEWLHPFIDTDCSGITVPLK